MSYSEFWKARQAEFEKYAKPYARLHADWRAAYRFWLLRWGEEKDCFDIQQQCKDVFNAIARRAVTALPDAGIAGDAEPWQLWLDFLHERRWGFLDKGSPIACTEREWDAGVKDGKPLVKVRHEQRYTTLDEWKNVYRRTRGGRLRKLSKRELRGKSSSDLAPYYHWLQDGTIENVFETSARFCEDLSSRAFEAEAAGVRTEADCRAVVAAIWEGPVPDAATSRERVAVSDGSAHRIFQRAKTTAPDFWRLLRTDFESLKPHSFGLIWTSTPPLGFQGEAPASRWTWFSFPDVSLRTRFSAFALRGAKALGYESEDAWYDLLRAEAADEPESGDSTRKPVGALEASHEYDSVSIDDGVRESITLCYKLEAASAPEAMPRQRDLIERLPEDDPDHEVLRRFCLETWADLHGFVAALYAGQVSLADFVEQCAKTFQQGANTQVKIQDATPLSEKCRELDVLVEESIRVISEALAPESERLGEAETADAVAEYSRRVKEIAARSKQQMFKEAIPQSVDPSATAPEQERSAGVPRRIPDLDSSRQRLALVGTLSRELAILKQDLKGYCTAETLKQKYPRFTLWTLIEDSQIRELVNGEAFTPKAYAEILTLAKFGLTSRETLKKDRRKLRQAGETGRK
jgi:hypothetical protein